MSVYSVSVYPGSVTIRKGEWYYGAYATVRASSNCCTDVTWYSDKTAVATVNAATGYIYGMSAGTARIYAQSKVDSSKWDYITVNVTNGNICVDSVCLNYGYLSLEKGDRRDLSATVCPANATNKSISWSSSNLAVATVSDGTVRAVGVGSATITATAQDGSGEYDTCYVSVTGDILVSSITLNHSSYTLNPNGAVLLRESICPTNATNKCVRWSSSNNSVARVNPDSGYVTAQGAGTAIITATAQDGSGKYAECRVTVNRPIAVMDIEVCPTSLTMNVGDVEYLCATIIPYNATNQSVTWCSSNENVATVGIHSGRITAKRAGTATITATTADGGYQACCRVEILLTDKQLSEQIVFCFSLLTEYSSYAYISPMQYAVLKGLDSAEEAEAEQNELLQSIQLVNYILLENRLVSKSPNACKIISKHILSGEKYDIFEQADITQDIRDHSAVFDEVWKERNKQSWLELAQLLVVAGTMIPYIQIPASLVLLGQGIVGKDLTGRQLPWWERTLNVASGVIGTVEGIGFLASAIKNANNAKFLDKLDDIARIAGDHTASELAYALKTGRITTRALDGILDAALISKAKNFRGSFIKQLATEGNVAVAQVNISGLKTDWFAHSQIDALGDMKPPNAVSNISLKPGSPVFTASEIGGFMRDVDTEYKILSDIANSLGNNTSATGTIKLLTERPMCNSCANVVTQFTSKYKNIVIEVVDNGHKLYVK